MKYSIESDALAWEDFKSVQIGIKCDVFHPSEITVFVIELHPCHLWRRDEKEEKIFDS